METRHYGNRKRRMAKFICDYCNKEVIRLITANKQESCGCNNYKFKHGDSISGKVERLYKIWRGMFDRCYNMNLKSYKYYGLKGIKVCNEWGNYISFRGWALNNGYKYNLTIDRIDNNKDYCPDNCQWITKQENTIKSSHKLTYNQASQIREEYKKDNNTYLNIAIKYKVSVSTIIKIIKNKGYII